MARTATDQPTTGQPSTGMRRFASPAVKALLRRRFGEFVGLFCGLGGLGLLVALGSYNPADPSWSTATSQATTNLAGPVGAVVADLLLQGFGYAAALPALALLAWAWRLATHRGLGLFPARLAALLAGLPALAAIFTLLPLPAEVPVQAGAGGIAGPVLSGGLRGMAQGLFGPMGVLVAEFLLALSAVLLAVAAFGLSLGEWRGMGRAAGTAAVASGQGARRAAGLFTRIGAGFGSLVRLHRRRRPVEPGADLTSVLRAAEAAAEAPPPVARHPALPPPPPPEPERNRDKPTTRVVSKEPKKAAAPQQPSLDLQDSAFKLPPLDLLVAPPAQRVGRPSEESLQANARVLEGVLEDYGVRGRIVEIRPGPVVTLYELEPAPGTKSARVIGLADDIAR